MTNLSVFVQLWCVGLYGFEFQKATGPRATQILKRRMESGEKKGLSVQWNLATRGATEQLCIAPRHPRVSWQPGETAISQDCRVLQLTHSLCGNHTELPYSYLCPQHLVPCLAHSFYSINIYSTSWTEYPDLQGTRKRDIEWGQKTTQSCPEITWLFIW